MLSRLLTMATLVVGVGATQVQAAGKTLHEAGLLWAQTTGGVTVKSGSAKSYVVESLVTVFLFGLTLWVVCKSSRRV